MKALSINSLTQEVNEIDITMQANTVYSFFGSILIDELPTLQKHTIYSDANALSEKKLAYFLGEQLLIGDALIIGKEALSEVDASIKKEELASLIKTSLNDFYKQTLALLSNTDINLYKTFLANTIDEEIALNTEWVLYTFNIADDKTKEYFLRELEKALKAKENPQDFMQKMAQLALKAGAL
jgi:hypothetical protein